MAKQRCNLRSVVTFHPDCISALCKAATARSQMMLPKLTRIDGVTLQLVHRWKIAPRFQREKHCRNDNRPCCIFRCLQTRNINFQEISTYRKLLITNFLTTSSNHHLQAHSGGSCCIIHHQTHPFVSHLSFICYTQ